MLTQAEKGQIFRGLHYHETAFIIPNPWDIGSARVLAHLGFDALATTSMGFAFSIGKRDNTVDRGQIMKHIAKIVAATDLPVSADLENGFGDSPEMAAETIRLAAAAGAVGGSIEDATGRDDKPIYEFERAPKIICMAVPTSKTRSSACRRISRRVLTCSTRRASPLKLT